MTDDKNAWLKAPIIYRMGNMRLPLPSELMLRIECDRCPDFYRVINSNYPPNIQWVSTHLRDNPDHKVSMYLTGAINEEE